MSANLPAPESAATAPQHGLAALRAELRCILQHPAISPERRQAAEPFITQCTEPAQLEEWLALAVAECGRWEEQMLASEHINEGCRRQKG